jgi:hypothetical protein
VTSLERAILDGRAVVTEAIAKLEAQAERSRSLNRGKEITAHGTEDSKTVR